ncbi:MAG: hypothetical protein R2848_15305 [Thermomicrobiales bacterium]
MTTAALTDPSLLRETATKQSDGFWTSAFHRLRRNRLAMVSALFLIALSLIAIIVPEFYRYTYAQQDYAAVTQGPSWAHPMGTDQLGRDILIRLIFGARISLTVGIVVQTVIMLIGVPAGLIAGYFGAGPPPSCVPLKTCCTQFPALRHHHDLSARNVFWRTNRCLSGSRGRTKEPAVWSVSTSGWASSDG